MYATHSLGTPSPRVDLMYSREYINVSMMVCQPLHHEYVIVSW